MADLDWGKYAADLAARTGQSQSAGAVVSTGTSLTAAIVAGAGTAGIGAAVVAFGASIYSYFGGKSISSWEQQNEVIGALVPGLKAAIEKSYSPAAISFINSKLVERWPAFVTGNVIHSNNASVNKIYLSAPEVVPALDSLLWVGLHLVFHAAPDLSAYEVSRRIKVLFDAFISPVLVEAKAQYGTLAPLSIPGAATTDAPEPNAAQLPQLAGIGGWIALALFGGFAFKALKK